MKHVVDTHALLWFVAASPRLGAAARDVLSDPQSELVLPAVALSEACWILERGKVAISLDEFLQTLETDTRIEVIPLDEEVVRKSLGLIAIAEMHDRQIVATALVLMDRGDTVDLLTRDANIVAAGLVPIVW
jgi:PIN domain nuclease of toxin-antitoxin system